MAKITVQQGHFILDKTLRITLISLLLVSFVASNSTYASTNIREQEYNLTNNHLEDSLSYLSIFPTDQTSNPNMAFISSFNVETDTRIMDLVVDSSGYSYITGFTNSTTFPVKNAIQKTLNSSFDVFITKFNSNGLLVFSTYFGGSGSDQAYAIAVDSSGNIYITGTTTSADFPLKNAYQTTFYGISSAFISKITPNGEIIYSTYLSGRMGAIGSGITVDSFGRSYLAGTAYSIDFPSSTIINSSLLMRTLPFISIFNSSGGLISSRLLGTNSTDYATGESIAIDHEGNYVTSGLVRGTNFLIKNAYQSNSSVIPDCFITKFNADNSINFSTFLGGEGVEEALDLALDSQGNIYLTGVTGSSNFPLMNNNRSYNSNWDGFFSKFSPTGQLLFSTYLGGNSLDVSRKISTDNNGNAYVLGFTNSTNFPTTKELITSSNFNKNPGNDNTNKYEPFLVEYDSSGAMVNSSLFGYQASQFGQGLTVDSSGNIFIAGITDSPNFLAQKKDFKGSNYIFYVDKFTSYPVSFTKPDLLGILVNVMIIGVAGLLFFGVIVYLLFEYRKYTKLKTIRQPSNRTKKHYSFKTYLKNKFGSRKESSSTELLSEKTIAKLQEIIDESTNKR